jgi:hypothetical protein
MWPLRYWIWTPGGLRTSWDTGCAPNDSIDGINCYRAQSNRLAKCKTGSEGFPWICPDAPSATPNVLSEELRPKWLDDALCKIPPSEYDDKWLNRGALAGSPLGWKETAIRAQTSCSSTNPQSDLRPHWLSCAHCTGYF